MKILLVSATKEEIRPTLEVLEANYSQTNPLEFHNNKVSINVLITGVGMVATAFQLGKTISSNPYDLALNAGIAGAINQNLNLGDTLQVTEDQFFNFGAEDKNRQLISVFDLGLIDENELPFKSGKLKTDYLFADLPKVKGITVQKVHGSKSSIKWLDSSNYDIETMEGAAFLYSTLLEGINCCQIRSISNYVEERQRENWDIPLAINNLNEVLIQYLNEL